MANDHDTDDEGWLDRLLAQHAEPPAPLALQRRVLADFDRLAARWSFARAVRLAADAVWPGAPLWQPAFALALSLMIGAGIATLAPLEFAQADDGAAFALDLPSDIDVGEGA